MKDVDDIIRHSLDPDSADLSSSNYTIRDQFGELADSFRGQSKMLSLFWILDVFILTALCVVSVVYMFKADDVRMTVIWSVAVLGLGITIGLTKIWFYMVLNRNRVVREIKRLELGVSLLSEQVQAGRGASDG